MDDEFDISYRQQQVDENLRRVFRRQEPDELPDRFQTLLRKLQEQESVPVQ